MKNENCKSQIEGKRPIAAKPAVEADVMARVSIAQLLEMPDAQRTAILIGIGKVIAASNAGKSGG